MRNLWIQEKFHSNFGLEICAFGILEITMFATDVFIYHNLKFETACSPRNLEIVQSFWSIVINHLVLISKLYSYTYIY